MPTVFPTSSSKPQLNTHYDIAVVGSGHNGLVAAAYLAAAGLSVVVLERQDYLGGATVSKKLFPEYDALISRYAYLVSLFPKKIIDDLQLDFRTARRQTASYTPYQTPDGQPSGLLFSNVDPDRSKQSMLELTGNFESWNRYQELLALQNEIAKLAWPSMTQKLRSRQDFVKQLSNPDQRQSWDFIIERPIGEFIETFVDDDLLRGIIATDAKIGVFTHPHDPTLLQNRCFLYHTIGNGTGEWQVPIGGMNALVSQLIQKGLQHGVQYRTNATVQHIELGSKRHTLTFESDSPRTTIEATRVLINATPRVYAKLLGETYSPTQLDEGSVVKVNMLLQRLPRLKAKQISPQEAFAGSLHIDEGYSAMTQSYQQALGGSIPDRIPFEIYCHTLTDPTILSPDLARQGYHTLTLFGLDMPYRLFQSPTPNIHAKLIDRYLDQLDQICEDDFRSCLAKQSDGQLCIELKTPVELENEVGLDLGNIFHNELSWFFTDDPTQVGSWGVETPYPRIYRCGSSAIRGGAVSGIIGHNTAKAIFEEIGGVEGTQKT